MTIQNLLARRMAAAAAAGGGGGSAYTFYDWIQCDDTAATSYIDTGIIPNKSKLWVFEGSFARTAALPSSYAIRSVFTRFTATTYSSNYSLMRYKNNTGGSLAFNYNAMCNSEANSGQPTTGATKGVWRKFELGPAENISNGGQLVIDDTETKTYTIGTSANSDAATTLKLLAGYPCRLAEFKVYYDGALYADLKPAMRNSDSVIGMYDAVRDTFYTPTGSATFTVGNGLDNFNS